MSVLSFINIFYRSLLLFLPFNCYYYLLLALLLDGPILIGKFNKHHKIKKNLLNLLKETNSETLKSIDNYYSDKISRLDCFTEQFS
jgi:hypothetical protein